MSTASPRLADSETAAAAQPPATSVAVGLSAVVSPMGSSAAATTAAAIAAHAAAAEASTALLACLRTALAAPDWQHSAAEVVSEISQRLKCLRVSIGWVVAGQLRVVALSDGVVLAEGVAIPELNQAMLESVHQHATLLWPQPTRQAVRITLAHQALFKAQGLAGVVSVPLAHKDQVIGVLCCERSVPSESLHAALRQDIVRGPFEPAEVRWLEQLAAALAPLFHVRYQLDRPWTERLRANLVSLRHRIKDPAEQRLRLSAIVVAGVVTWGLIYPMPYRVSAKARLEGAVQRVLSASQDGYLREVHVRPGDVVKAGQLLAELSDDDLQSARRGRVAEVAQQENAFAEAFARGDRGQAAMAQTKISEAKAQLALVDQQLARVRLTAPFDGVVIQGDLRQQLGAPVKRGDPLLTLAPGLDWRVVLEVSESDVAELQRGQTANLRLAAMPGQPITLVIDRVTPVARSTADGVRYEVEARPSGQGAGLAGLRPGLEGIAKVELKDRPVIWRWAVHGWRWLRMAVWTWL
ncbi:MAG: HlyD family efflux transporter periplasmic adaptor subunit [Rubrivivax sp.]|nr:MAG: HlyD family efflux transporter periplasmic adaptor subunit [Rubrivivax sp.]